MTDLNRRHADQYAAIVRAIIEWRSYEDGLWPSPTIDDLAAVNVINRSRATISYRVKELVNAGVIKPTGTRPNCYNVLNASALEGICETPDKGAWASGAPVISPLIDPTNDARGAPTQADKRESGRRVPLAADVAENDNGSEHEPPRRVAVRSARRISLQLGTTPLLLKGDCLSHMSSIPDASVNLAILDLPYGGHKTHCDWDIRIDFDPFWTEICRVLHPKGVVVAFASQPFTTDLIASNREWFRYSLVWRKTRPTGFQLSKHRPLAEHEDVLIFSPGNCTAGKQNDEKRSTYNPQGLVKLHSPRHHSGSTSRYLTRSAKGAKQEWTNFPRSVLEFASVIKNVHETQKPVDLLRYLIRTYSNAGDVVLDPTMGSGSTGVAALEEDRQFIGIEKSDKYFALASARVISKQGRVAA